MQEARYRRPDVRGPIQEARCKIFFAFCFLLLTPCFFGMVSPSLAGVADTVHNLSVSGPGDIRSLTTTQVCVFCHTPHHSNPAGPLWNKSTTGVTYSPYSSSTVVPTLNQPDGSSRMCLSCHDGALAIGGLLNLPGAVSSGTLQMSDAGTGKLTVTGELSPTAVAYLGIDLKDDHPISFLYSASESDPEIVASGSLPPSIKLDINGKLQCTSCHNPHDDTYPNFLVMNYGTGAPLCTACHNKGYWTPTHAPSHKTSSATWTGTAPNPWHLDLDDPTNTCESNQPPPSSGSYCDDTPAIQACFSCHRSHGSGSNRMLSKVKNPSNSSQKGEEWACLPCHNGNVASVDIETLIINGVSKHPVKDVYLSHNPKRYPLSTDPIREDPQNLGQNRHAECSDCHDSHASKTGKHQQGLTGNVIGAVLVGSWGVKPNTWPTAPASGDPAPVPFSDYIEIDFDTTIPDSVTDIEAYMCLKCHSEYAYFYIVSNPDVPSGNADGSLVKTKDMSIDFNPNIHSYHPIFAQGKNQPPTTANLNWPANNMGLTNTFMYAYGQEQGWNPNQFQVQYDSLITCTDCHEPHGSSNKWLLKSVENMISTEWPTVTTQNFCYNCHRRDVYGDEDYVSNAIDGNGNLIRDYARVTHPVDGLGTGSPFYQGGIGTGNDSNKWEILCLSCHGGGYDSTNDNIEAIHGSNKSAGPLGGSDPLGYRLMNGACVESYARPITTADSGTLTFRNIADPLNDKTCNGNFAGITINPSNVNYDCTDIEDCNPYN